MTLKSVMAADVTDVFLSTDDFAETVTLIDKDSREYSLDVVIQEDQTPLEDNRAAKRRVQRCMVWGELATNTGDDPPAFAHEDGAIVPRLPMAMVRAGDTRNRWDFTGELTTDVGGMIGCRFQRIVIEESGDLTPGIGR